MKQWKITVHKLKKGLNKETCLQIISMLKLTVADRLILIMINLLHLWTKEQELPMIHLIEYKMDTKIWIRSYLMIKFHEVKCLRCFRLNSVRSRLLTPLIRAVVNIQRFHQKLKELSKQLTTWLTWYLLNLLKVAKEWKQD